MSLRVGDVITTQKDMRQPVIVSVEGVPKFRAKLGAFKGHKAIMIDGTIENPIECAGGVNSALSQESSKATYIERRH